jgi:GntR family transcriptional repressor for pyruvate dehydrogenase complex
VQLRRYILESGLAPGDKLPSERVIGARLGLGRASVREAMRFLEHEGLVEVRQGRPSVVRAFEFAPVMEPLVQRLAAERGALRDLLEVRVPLEVLAARWAAARRSAEDVAALRACLDEARKALERREDTTEQDLLFHDLLYRAGRNSAVMAFMRAAKGLLRSVREAAHTVRGYRDRSWSEHHAVFEAVAAGDAAAAEAAMQAHMSTVMRQQEAALRQLDKLAKTSRVPGRTHAPA